MPITIQIACGSGVRPHPTGNGLREGGNGRRAIANDRKTGNAPSPVKSALEKSTRMLFNAVAHLLDTLEVTVSSPVRPTPSNSLLLQRVVLRRTTGTIATPEGCPDNSGLFLPSLTSRGGGSGWAESPMTPPLHIFEPIVKQQSEGIGA